MLSRAKPAVPSKGSKQSEMQPEKSRVPPLDEFIAKRDFLGAITLLEVYST
jgi:hypothetical protein